VSQSVSIIQADIFTERPFAGNPAAAVLDADHLDASAMQRIAAEMLVPGTAFVSASTQAGVDWRLRMFTPRREVGYSGHTALCGTHALVESGRLPGDRVTYDTPSGLLRVDVERGEGRALMWLEPPLPACRPFEGDMGEILDSLGLARAAVGGWAADGCLVFTAEQGDGLGRPGRLQVELTVKAGHAARVRVGGSAVTVLTGTLRSDG